jgi:DUF971 family protein
MTSITQFILDADNAQLKITFNHNEAHCYSIEYLRVCAPSVTKALVSHKKQVKLVTIEPIGKHGYRFIFDDEFSDIYTTEYLHLLHQEYDNRWQAYLNDIAKSQHSREASINFTAV